MNNRIDGTINIAALNVPVFADPFKTAVINDHVPITKLIWMNLNFLYHLKNNNH